MLTQYDYVYAEKEKEAPQEAVEAMNLNVDVDQHFFADSRATAHMTNNAGKLKRAILYKVCDKIFVGNGKSLPLSHHTLKKLC